MMPNKDQRLGGGGQGLCEGPGRRVGLCSGAWSSALCPVGPPLPCAPLPPPAECLRPRHFRGNEPERGALKWGVPGAFLPGEAPGPEDGYIAARFPAPGQRDRPPAVLT